MLLFEFVSYWIKVSAKGINVKVDLRSGIQELIKPEWTLWLQHVKSMCAMLPRLRIDVVFIPQTHQITWYVHFASLSSCLICLVWVVITFLEIHFIDISCVIYSPSSSGTSSLSFTFINVLKEVVKNTDLSPLTSICLVMCLTF